MSNSRSTRSTKKKAVVLSDAGRDADNSDVDEREEASDLGGLTEKQAAFVQAFVSGPSAANGTKSAVVAGYSEKSAANLACYLQNLPKVIAAIDATLREAIGTRLTVKAVSVIEDILDNAEASLKLKGEMASRVIEFSGLVQRAQMEKAKQTGLSNAKGLGEMTRAELEDVVRKGAGILQAAASLPPAGPLIEGDSTHNSTQPAALAAE